MQIDRVGSMAMVKRCQHRRRRREFSPKDFWHKYYFSGKKSSIVQARSTINKYFLKNNSKIPCPKNSPHPEFYVFVVRLMRKPAKLEDFLPEKMPFTGIYRTILCGI